MVETQSWDRAAALRGVENDMELLVEMAQLFLADSSKLVREIGQAVDKRDARALQYSAHTYKGSVANFAAQPARDAAYTALGAIDWPEGFCRQDIGWRALGKGP